MLTRHLDKIFRIGTGELTDSLALDWLTGFTRYLVPFFAEHKNAFLELKTKTVEIDTLEHLKHEGQTIISWSLNTPKIIAVEEYKTCSLNERLHSARRCTDWGYRLGFHFDPLVHYPEWEADYQATVNQLFETIPARQIAWISLGALRLPPGLRAIMLQRFPNSPLPLGEFVLGIDGKGRYFRPLRRSMYQKMAQWIRGHNPKQVIYLCMESPQVWRQSLGWEPSSSEVASMLDDSVRVGIGD
jgi:spore photoproduct lyase